jgi:hypothetical protein
MVKKICVNLRDLRAKQLYLNLETDKQHWMKIYFIGGGGFFLSWSLDFYHADLIKRRS